VPTARGRGAVFLPSKPRARQGRGRQHAGQRFVVRQAVNAVANRARNLARFAPVAVVERIVDPRLFPRET
jgi:hypothetical protein